MKIDMIEKAEDVVSKEEAIWAKENGFREFTIFYYLLKRVPFVGEGLKYVKSGIPMNHNSYGDYVCSAPFREDFEKWKLKEEYAKSNHKRERG